MLEHLLEPLVLRHVVEHGHDVRGGTGHDRQDVHDGAKRSSVRVFDPARQRRHSDQRGILETVLVTALNAVESVGILVHAGHAVQVWQRDTVPLACLDDVPGQATNESG